MGKITKKLIADYDHASTFVYGKVPLGSPEWIDPDDYIDEDEIIEEWGSWFGANDTMEVEDHSISLIRIPGNDPYHDDTLAIDMTVKQVFGEDEPFESDEEREEYESNVGMYGPGRREKTVHSEVPISELSADELRGLIEQLAKGACGRPSV